jgi:hypothetical protein
MPIVYLVFSFVGIPNLYYASNWVHLFSHKTRPCCVGLQVWSYFSRCEIDRSFPRAKLRQSLAGSIRNPLMRRIALVVGLLILAGVAFIGCLVVQGLNEVSTLQPGMIELHLPSGATAYLRRQSVFDKPAEVYISASDVFCKPFDRWHDYKMSAPIHGALNSPLLISYSGDTIVVHAPKKPQTPWFSGVASFKVAFQELSLEEYAAYASGKSGIELPVGWNRVEIPFGHNTCAL